MKQPARKAWSELGWQIAGALFAVAMIGAVTVLFLRVEDTRKLSPCSENARSDKCAEQREAVARAEPLRNPCISSQRVTGHRGRFCPRFYVKRPGARAPSLHAEGPTEQPTTAVPTPKGGSHVAPAPSSGGAGGGKGKPHDGDPAATSPADSSPGSETPVADHPAPEPTPGQADPGAPPSPGLVEQTTGAAAGVVDQAGKDVQQTVDNATCNPLISLCPK